MNLNAEKVRELPVPLPPLEEQLRIVAKVTELLERCSQLRAHIAASRTAQTRLADAIMLSAISV